MPKIPKPTEIKYSWWHKHKPSVLPKSGVGELLKRFEKVSIAQRIAALATEPITYAGEVSGQYLELENKIKQVQKIASAKKDCAEFYDALTELLKLFKAERVEFETALKKHLSATNNNKADLGTKKTYVKKWPEIRKNREHEIAASRKLLTGYQNELPNATTMDDLKDLIAKTKGLEAKIDEFRKSALGSVNRCDEYMAELDDMDDLTLDLRAVKADASNLEKQLRDVKGDVDLLQEAIMKAGKDLKGTKKAGEAFLKTEQRLPNVPQRKRDDDDDKPILKVKKKVQDEDAG